MFTPTETVCAICGKTFLKNSPRNTLCSKECARENNRRNTRLSDQRRKCRDAMNMVEKSDMRYTILLLNAYNASNPNNPISYGTLSLWMATGKISREEIERMTANG
jgi:hypothetical protein